MENPSSKPGPLPASEPTRVPTRVPYSLYTDPDIYARELERIFYGKSWVYVGLEAEIPNPYDFKTTDIGERPVIISRDKQGVVHVLANRCAHRGVKLVRAPYGNTTRFACPYHCWVYKTDGSLFSLPFQKGVNGQGGMPESFNKGEQSLDKLKVACRNGVIFASFDADVEPLEDYLGEAMTGYFDRVFNGRKLRLLGNSRQLIPANWKLMFENIKDPYHASLLHVFLVTFGLFRADNPSAVKMDATGRHCCLISTRGEQKHTEATKDIANLRSDFKLHDPRLLDPVKEFPDSHTVIMQTLWPNLIIQQQSNTLATRQIIPRGPDAFELYWTYFGYETDDEAMITRRLRQANLMGPAGYVSTDDSEVMKLSQDALRHFPDQKALLEMGGFDAEDTDHMVTEAGIRAFYDYYYRIMEL